MQSVKRKTRFNLPITFAFEPIHSGGLLNILASTSSPLVVTRDGKTPSKTWTDRKGVTTSKGIQNADLLAIPEVAQQLAEEYGAFYFPPSGPENSESEKVYFFEAPHWDVTEKSFPLKTLLGALHATRRNLSEPNSLEKNYKLQALKTKISQLEGFSGQAEKITLHRNRATDCSIMSARLSIKDGYSKGVSEARLVITNGFHSSGVYLPFLSIEERMTVSPKQVFSQIAREEEFKAYLTDAEARIIVSATQEFAKEQAKTPRQEVAVSYDQETKRFALYQDMYADEKDHSKLVSVPQIIESVERVRDYLMRVVEVGWKEYQDTMTMRIRQRRFNASVVPKQRLPLKPKR